MARGDQIYVYRPWLGWGSAYEHHGIDCGDGTVIHYSKREGTTDTAPPDLRLWQTATVRRVPLAEFSHGKPVYVKRYPTRFIGEEVVRRAESRLGEQRYNLLFENCEHFATWCATGVSDSEQVRDFVPFLVDASPEQVAEAVDRAIAGSTSDRPPAVLRDALQQIETVWNDLQPRYNQLVRDRRDWDRVARTALARDREDLARGAIARKLAAERQATQLKTQLDHLATLTETLIRQAQQAGLDL